MTDFSITKYNKISSSDLQEKAVMFFDYLDASVHTRREYKYRIKMFIEQINIRGFDRNSFLEFKRYLASREDFSVATKNKYLATARIFLKELYRLGLIPVEITVNIRSFTQSTKHKREGLNQGEIELLVGKIHALPSGGRNARLKALFSLLVFQGLRQIEVSRLDVKDLDFVAKKAYVLGKGRDDKEAVHLLPQTLGALRTHMRINKVASGALFKGYSNRSSERITTRTILREIKDLFGEVGIEKTVHGLRHYYVTTLLERFDVRDVRKFSRHRSLEMLIVYDDEIDLGKKSQEVAECFKNLKIE